MAIGLLDVFAFLSMEPPDSGSVADTGIFVLKVGMSCMYAVSADGGYIFFDAGASAGAARVEMKRAGIGMDSADVFLTHSDTDHVAALGLFKGANIYIGEDEIQMIDGSTARAKGVSNSLPGGAVPTRLTQLPDGRLLGVRGHSIYCMKVPGHTPGSMAYILDEKYLFTGDALRVKGNRIRMHPFAMDKARAAESVKKLAETMRGCEYVLTAHYGFHATGGLVY